jgi:hypothetical protein
MRPHGLAIALVALAITGGARADQPRATSVELFNRGRALAQENKCAQAVPFFLDTLKLEPSVGALLNLAECHEKLGDASQAFTRYREAETLAQQKHDDREALAHARWQALIPRVPKITVVAPPGVAVRVDGNEAGDAMPVAAGDHEITASAAGRQPWTTRVHVAGSGVVTVNVPELVVLEQRTAPVTHARSGGEGRIAGVFIAITGAVVLAVGGACGGVALSDKNQAQGLSTEPNQMQPFDDARASAKAFADASTVLFVVGGVLAAGGLTIWLASPRAHVAVTASLGWLGIGGSF